jgi:hypothetical protein
MNTSSLPSVFQSTLLYHYLSCFKTQNFKTQLAYFFFLKRVIRWVKRNRPLSLWLKSGERDRRSLFHTGGERGKGAIKFIIRKLYDKYGIIKKTPYSKNY